MTKLIMDEVIRTVKDISSKLSETENKRKSLAEYIKSKTDLNFISKSLPKYVEKVAAVDGGIVTRSLHGMDLVLVRSGGVCFNYREGKIESVVRRPSTRFPGYDAHVFSNLSESDWRTKANILRQKKEIERVLEMLEERPQIMLLDGSVVPHQAYKPSNHEELYDQLIAKYREMYAKSYEYGVKLVGVVEDSRSRVYCEFLKQIITGVDTSVLDITRDTSLLFNLLDEGEKTNVFSYSKDPSNHPTLSDLKEYGNDCHSFYFKTVRNDRPLRIDFLSKNPLPDVEEISSFLLSLSATVSYGIPAPIIEADNISKMSEKEMSDFHSQILAMAGELPDVMKRRREQRPF